MAKIERIEDIEAWKVATELQSHLCLAADQGYLNKEEFEAPFAIAIECKNLIGGFARCLRSHPGSRTSNTKL